MPSISVATKHLMFPEKLSKSFWPGFGSESPIDFSLSWSPSKWTLYVLQPKDAMLPSFLFALVSKSVTRIH